MIALLLVCAGVQAESAKRILDKAAATVSNPGGVQAHFQMISKQFGTTDGDIAVKGSKFHATTSGAIIWFDGKTQWTKIQEMYIIVDKNSYHPTHVKMKQKDKWSTIIISQLKTASLSDELFVFNSKDFPKAEIIDLR